MRIAVLSDTHGRTATVAKALALVRAAGVTTVLHCGDVDDADTVLQFRGFDAHFVYGNCDHDREGLRRAAAEAGVTLHEPFGHLELEGVKIAWLHGDDAGLMRDVEHSEAYDFLFYGHTHQAKEHRTGPTRVINPGALQRARVKTFVLLDLPGGAVESVVVEP
jgi:putative phosphoesterase